MALGSTMYVFTVRIADADRNVYESLTLRVAQHPSEAAEYLITRVLAYCLEYAEGITFSKGLSDPEEPTIGVRDLTGVLQSWIDIGAPEAPRLHKAGKAARRVAVYAHREVTPRVGENALRVDGRGNADGDGGVTTSLIPRICCVQPRDAIGLDGSCRFQGWPRLAT